MLIRRIAAVALSGLLSGAALPGQAIPAGVILQTNQARLNSADAQSGTTVFDGDRLETQSKGLVNLRSGQVQLALAEESTLWMNHDSQLLAPTLQRGTVTFRAEVGSGVEIRADDVRVRPHNPVLTVGQVTLEDCYVVVTAITQQLEVTAAKETRILDEGKTYRVARLGACGAAMQQAAPVAGQSRFYLAAAGIIGGLGIWGVRKALESPDRP
jgi:hypothetical protein